MRTAERRHSLVDDVVVRLAGTTGARVFRGHPTDLLDGHYRGALEARADVVALIPSSCALLDPIALERVLACFVRARGGFDYVTNLHPATWPDGNDVEVVPMALLEIAWCDAELGFERQHTTPFFWMQPDRFRIGNVAWETGLDLSRSHRFVVEHEEDLRFAQAIYDELWRSGRPIFSLGDVLDLLTARPALLEINARHGGARWYAHPPWRSPSAVPSLVGA